jgi:hypothetical protein
MSEVTVTNVTMIDCDAFLAVIYASQFPGVRISRLMAYFFSLSKKTQEKN